MSEPLHPSSASTTLGSSLHPTTVEPIERLETRFLIIGAGVAGLRAAIELAPFGDVLVVAKDSLRESSSEYAQGGIAVALADDDSPELHLADTLFAGDGLSDQAAARTLTAEGPPAIRELIGWGAQFDCDPSGHLLFAREGAHSRARVLHAHGDSTGREIARTLYAQAAQLPSVRLRGFSAVSSLILHHGRVAGAWALDHNSHPVEIRAASTLLATGGLGCLFETTTNPDVATGDGVAMAYRAGARLSDLEFVQFHPTALHLPGAPSFLLSEALRGEGAFLLNALGQRFMPALHPLAELAPRDVVARCIFDQIASTGAVFLDLSHRGPGFVSSRFPRVHSTCLRYGIDLDRQPAPIAPAAHYSMGGVHTDLLCRTSLPGLFAAGEVASTGVHGANRLASNSLLEALVFGARAGRAMASEPPAPLAPPSNPLPLPVPDTSESDLRAWASSECGIFRDADRLHTLLHRLQALPFHDISNPSRPQVELASRSTVLELMTRAALARLESRGAHRRIDYPETSALFRKHSMLQASDNEVTFA